MKMNIRENDFLQMLTIFIKTIGFAEVFPEKLEMVEDECIDEVLGGIAEICKIL